MSSESNDDGLNLVHCHMLELKSTQMQLDVQSCFEILIKARRWIGCVQRFQWDKMILLVVQGDLGIVNPKFQVKTLFAKLAM